MSKRDQVFKADKNLPSGQFMVKRRLNNVISTSFDHDVPAG